MTVESLTDLEPRKVSRDAMEALADGMDKSSAALVHALGTNGPEFQTAVIVFCDEGRAYGVEVRRKTYDRKSKDFESWEIVPCRIKAGGKA